MSRRRRRSRASRATEAGRHPQEAPRPRSTGRTYALDFANPLLRGYGFVVDLSIIVLLFMILNRLTGGAVGSPDSPVQDVFIFFGYFVLFTGIFGQTPGKYAAGIVVVDRDGRVPSVALAIPREIAGRAIATAALGIGLLWIIYDQNRQGWHDKLAGTFVVTKPNSGVPGLLGRFMRKKRR